MEKELIETFKIIADLKLESASAMWAVIAYFASQAVAGVIKTAIVVVGIICMVKGVYRCVDRAYIDANE